MNAMGIVVTAARAALPFSGSLQQVAAQVADGRTAAQPGTGLLEHCPQLLGAPLHPSTLVDVWPPTTRPEKKRARYLKRMGTVAMHVGQQAACAVPHDDGARLAVFTALSGIQAHWNDVMPALQRQAPDGEQSWARGFHRLSPLWMLSHLSNNVHGDLAIAQNAVCDGATFGGETAGAQALVAARRSLLLGHCDRALVVAYDSWLCPEKVASVLAHHHTPFPVMGEAAVALVVERRADARERAQYALDADASADHEASLRRVRKRLHLDDSTVVDTLVLPALGESGAASALVQTVVLGALCSNSSHGSVEAKLATGAGSPPLCWALGVKAP